MASSSRSNMERMPSKKTFSAMTRTPTLVDVPAEDIPSVDSEERVPSSLAPVLVPILRVSSAVENENPRIGYLCRYHAFEKAHKMDKNSSGRGVRQFKTYMMHRLKKEDSETKGVDALPDSRRLQIFYQKFYEDNIEHGECTKKPEEMAKIYQVATVLYDVFKTVAPSDIDEKTQRYADQVERKREQYVHYNILPLYDVGVKPAIMELKEIRSAFEAIRNNINKLPFDQSHLSQGGEHPKLSDQHHRPFHDILEWLALLFGFQKGNVANQREHLILLLANAEARSTKDHNGTIQQRQDTLQNLRDAIFKNYLSWCEYLHKEHHIRTLSVRGAGEQNRQIELLYIALYLLIWGEASNIRFMPECICYIFHMMADQVYGILCNNAEHVTGEVYQISFQSEEWFLKNVITPIYEVLLREVKRNRGGRASHSQWRNYDDLNEYFWSSKCFELGWPMNKSSDFFVQLDLDQMPNKVVTGKRKSKTNFVEVRTFWHLFRSFDRMWIFLILSLQAMIILACSPSGSITALFDEDVFKKVLSIFITAAFLNTIQAVLDIILTFRAWGNMEFSQIIRYLLKLAAAVLWAVLLPISFSSSVINPTGLLKLFSSWEGNLHRQNFYYYCISIYLIPNMISVFLFFFPTFRKMLERSNARIIVLFMWWAQPKLYIGRGMHDGMFILFRYTLFWIVLIMSKLAFSYYVEILPLVGPTKLIMSIKSIQYEWHEFFPNAPYNIGVVIAIWAPIILVFLMDTSIWYSIYATIFGGILGAFTHLGEIRTLGMLRARFEAVPLAFNKRLVPPSEKAAEKNKKSCTLQRSDIAKFSHVWNEVIYSMRMEDLISNRERDLLLVPSSFSDVSVLQWPPFLLASKIPIALDMAKDFKGREDADLFKRINSDCYMRSAVIECYETFRNILKDFFQDKGERLIVDRICEKVENSIKEKKFLTAFRVNGMPLLSDKLEKFLKTLLADYNDVETQKANAIKLIQDIMEIIMQDIMINGHEVLEAHSQNVESSKSSKAVQKFENIRMDLAMGKSCREKVVRLYLLLTVKESAINVPMNLEARRRITFFTNSLFMNMPSAPRVHDMLSFSVLTPYYKEDVLYSEEELSKENDDGISILFYLRKIYPDEWTNFQERISDPTLVSPKKDEIELTRHWASNRGQTLSRTVRGMMYYRQALELQSFLESAEEHVIYDDYHAIDPEDSKLKQSKALVDMKFTYVVSCQIYGAQKKSDDPRDKTCYQNILNLMLTHPSLRVAYIDAREEMVNGCNEKVYYSVLLKGGDKFDEEIYRIKLPGPPSEIGEGKPENQNHAIIFTRGEALQTIDMNQDNYLEEALKMRNVLEELKKSRHGRKPTILGLREHIFTGSVSSLAWFMSNQETSFVTIGQRVLANPLRVRFHYGHPDIFDRVFHLTRGGISKASRIINLSEDIFSGFNSTLRTGCVTHHEYIQVGKGRDVGMNQISLFEAKVANGNGEQTLSRDVFRLGHRFDFYRMFSFYFTTVGFYFNSMVTVLTVYVFLYGRLYMVMSGLEKGILEDPAVHESKALEQALASQSIFQLGLLLVLPMVMEIGLERGFRAAVADFVIMQLQLAPVFFTFQLGTKAHYYGRTLLYGGSKYRATGRGFVVFHAKFSDNYRQYSRSHFVKGLELLVLLLVYEIYADSYRSSNLYFFITCSMWFLVSSWLFAPFVFNPSGFDWQKTVDDWTDWKRWMGNRGGIGIQPDKSWDSWWDEQQEHLRYTNIRGRVFEIILAIRFLIFQYGIVYHLDIAHKSKSCLVYGLSWVVMATVLLVLKMVSMGRRGFGTDFQLMFRILKGLLFIGFVIVMTVLILVCGLTIRDIFASLLAFMPTGWAILLIGQACRPLVKGIWFWDSIRELGRSYEYVMGLIIFIPIAVLSWFPFVSEFQTRLLFNQAFSRGLQISMILAGRKDRS